MKSLEAATHTLYQNRVKLDQPTNYQLIKGIIDHGLSKFFDLMSSLRG